MVAVVVLLVLVVGSNDECIFIWTRLLAPSGTQQCGKWGE
jgi:hypothetical protein